MNALTDAYDVLIVGAGVAGQSASIFTARHGLDTLLVDGGDSLLRRNAHLENYPGFPAGVNARLLLDMMADQAERSGAERLEATVVDLVREDEGFVAETDDGDRIGADYAVVATKNTVDFLEGFEGLGLVQQGSKRFVDAGEHGRTGVDGLYATGRVALKPHQTIVAAGHGAEVAVTLIEDSDVPFYHDWVAPEGYFTGRDREVPPGCEEIDADEFRRREGEALETMREYVAERHPDEPQQHPSVRED